MLNDYCEIIYSVGIDIGTTTTQFVLSELSVKNIAPGSLVPHYEITDKVVIYKSPIEFTPLDEKGLIDGAVLFDFVKKELKMAGVHSDKVRSGAVIITGEAAKKENAQVVSQSIADFTGDFVVATAGGRLEGIIAGKGSGACAYSKDHFCTVANIDIGGGTTNIGVFKNGSVIASVFLDVGGRLIEVDQNLGIVTHISPSMYNTIKNVSLNVVEGSKWEYTKMKCLSDEMARLVWNKINEISGIDVIMFSGGVAEFVNNPIITTDIYVIGQYGDIGPLLGQSLAKAFNHSQYMIVEARETIRATVIGAGAQTMDVSGSTILIDNSSLPIKNIPVILPFSQKIDFDIPSLIRHIVKARETYYEIDVNNHIAIGIIGTHQLKFKEVQNLAEALYKSHPVKSLPLIVVLEEDVGKALGHALRVLDSSLNLICIDQLSVQEGDYLDIGQSIAKGSIVPVIIKTLVFNS